ETADGYAVAPGSPQPGTTPYPGSQDDAGPTPYPQAETELARIDWSWLRFAPFSLSSLVVVAGAAGVLSQVGDDLPIDQLDVAQDTWHWIVAQAVVVLLAFVVLAVVVGWVVVSTVSYVLTWWNLRVVRERQGNLR